MRVAPVVWDVTHLAKIIVTDVQVAVVVLDALEVEGSNYE